MNCLLSVLAVIGALWCKAEPVYSTQDRFALTRAYVELFYKPNLMRQVPTSEGPSIAVYNGPRYTRPWSMEELDIARYALTDVMERVERRAPGAFGNPEEDDPRAYKRSDMIGRRDRILRKLDHGLPFYDSHWRYTELTLLDSTGSPWRSVTMTADEAILTGLLVSHAMECRAFEQDMEMEQAERFCAYMRPAAKELEQKLEHQPRTRTGGAIR